jgi:hypothetical protein
MVFEFEPSFLPSDAVSKTALDKSLLETTREIPLPDVRRFAKIYGSSSLQLPVSGLWR